MDKDKMREIDEKMREFKELINWPEDLEITVKIGAREASVPKISGNGRRISDNLITMLAEKVILLGRMMIESAQEGRGTNDKQNMSSKLLYLYRLQGLVNDLAVQEEEKARKIDAGLPEEAAGIAAWFGKHEMTLTCAKDSGRAN